jgi:hypothetical protein
LFKLGKWPPRNPAWSYWLTVIAAAAWLVLVIGTRVVGGGKTSPLLGSSWLMVGVGICSLGVGVGSMYSRPTEAEGYSTAALITLKVVGGFFIFIGLMLTVFGLLRFV